MISDYAKRQGQEYQKLSQDRQPALFWNTPPLAPGILYYRYGTNTLCELTEAWPIKGA